MHRGFELGGPESPTYHPDLSLKLNETLALNLPLVRDVSIVNEATQRHPATRLISPLEKPVVLPYPNSPKDIFEGSYFDDRMTLHEIPDAAARWALYREVGAVMGKEDKYPDLEALARDEILAMLQNGFNFRSTTLGTPWGHPATWRLFALAPNLVIDTVLVASELRANPSTRGEELEALSEELYVMHRLIASGLVDRYEHGKFRLHA